MPLPNPRPNENMRQFVGRCMGDSKAIQEFPNKRQRYAVCINKYKNKS